MSPVADLAPSPLPAPTPPGYLDTAALRDGLGGRGVRSGLWSVGAQGVQVALGVGSAAVLARLLTPADFGVIAMVSTAAALVQSLRHFGLPLATLHGEALAPRQADALFWLGLGLSAAVSLALAALAPLLAWGFDEPRVVGPTRAMAAALFVLAAGAQHRALLMRQMHFRALAGLSTGAAAVGIAVGVGAALLGAGYWALVGQTLAQNLAETLGAWTLCRWRPRRGALRGAGARALATYGRDVSASSVLDYAGRNLDRVLVGVAAGPAALGLYDNAYRWSLFPVQRVHGPLLEVSVAGLSRVRGDAAAFRSYTRQSARAVLAATLPPLAFVAVAAAPVVRVLLGPQWGGAVPLLQWLALAACARTVAKTSHWLYLAEGRTRRQLAWALGSAPVMMAGVALGLWAGGVEGVAVGFAAASGLLLGPEVALALRGSQMTPGDFAGAVWRPAAASAAAAGALAAARVVSWPAAAPLLDLALSAGLFACVLAGTWLLLPGGPRAALDVVTLLRRRAPTPDA